MNRIKRVAKYILYSSKSPYWLIHEGYYCPCCNNYVKKMMEIKDFRENSQKFLRERYNTVRQDVFCPNCHSLPRHRIEACWLKKERRNIKGKDILYFAIEKGILRWFEENRIRVTTADLFEKADLQLNIEDTGLMEETYDYVFCNHVLEHVDDYKKALKEIHRILRTNGKLVCSFPIDETYNNTFEDTSKTTTIQRVETFGQYDHKRIFGSDAKEIIEQEGFLVQVYHGENLSPTILPIVGPADYDKNYLFICKKI